MRTDELTRTMENLFGELMHGVSGMGGFVLNVGDGGLLRSLERLSASEASALTRTGSSIASHVNHVRYGLSLMNRWSHGENPFKDADWSTSWKKTSVTAAEWEALRIQLRDEAARWLVVLRTPREVQGIELSGMIGSIAHLAYHVGAIRQINVNARGSIFSPSWMSIALRVLPSRLESNRRDGSGRLAPLANVSFTTFLYVSPVQTIPSCDQTGARHPIRRLPPFPLLDHLGSGLEDQRPHAGQGPA